ncbi:hypothetical protein NIIDMKKI_42700 [Mycobacterium kansasii]|uniref:Uncharacterized protein n=1 Tax=Mycobacterium kansasii TaxID=1768 RepID=A0A7G1IF59_MYCKA|nr:hypothetical protein NIIDMKKI_42700 [Mycobacterium kansasii]
MQTRLWAMVAIVLSLAAPGCAASGNRPQSTTTQTMPAAVKTVEVTDGSGQQLTQEVTMSVGDVLRVILGANHSTLFGGALIRGSAIPPSLSRRITNMWQALRPADPATRSGHSRL